MDNFDKIGWQMGHSHSGKVQYVSPVEYSVNRLLHRLNDLFLIIVTENPIAIVQHELHHAVSDRGLERQGGRVGYRPGEIKSGPGYIYRISSYFYRPEGHRTIRDRMVSLYGPQDMSLNDRSRILGYVLDDPKLIFALHGIKREARQRVREWENQNR